MFCAGVSKDTDKYRETQKPTTERKASEKEI